MNASLSSTEVIDLCSSSDEEPSIVVQLCSDELSKLKTVKSSNVKIIERTSKKRSIAADENVLDKRRCIDKEVNTQLVGSSGYHEFEDNNCNEAETMKQTCDAHLKREKYSEANFENSFCNVGSSLIPASVSPNVINQQQQQYNQYHHQIQSQMMYVQHSMQQFSLSALDPQRQQFNQYQRVLPYEVMSIPLSSLAVLPVNVINQQGQFIQYCQGPFFIHQPSQQNRYQQQQQLHSNQGHKFIPQFSQLSVNSFEQQQQHPNQYDLVRVPHSSSTTVWGRDLLFYYPEVGDFHIFEKAKLEMHDPCYDLLELPLYSRLIKALRFEDLQAFSELESFLLSNVDLKGNRRHYYVEHPKTAEIFTMQWRQMCLCLSPNSHSNKNQWIDRSLSSNINISNVDKKRNILVSDYGGYINASQLFRLELVPNRMKVRLCIKAVEALQSSGLEEFFIKFEHSAEPESYDKIDKIRATASIISFEWFNGNIGENDKQQEAIRNIVNCTAHPYPQVIFGPPGTGKTSTLVECVLQILKYRADSHIIIATQTNSASDEIGRRLGKFISSDVLCRFYASSGNNLADPELRNFSNLDGNRKSLQKFPVIISTLITSSRLASFDFAPGHFDYIFVDEISCATEPEALVPIVCLGMSSDKITANIVLLGDHFQLGPVLQFGTLSAKLGLGISMMERIMGTEKYLKNPTYDDRFVVQLLDNYRSHPAILKFSSDQFYDRTLRAKMPPSEQKLTEDLNCLPNKKFPIIFHAVETRSQLKGTSSYNDGEIEVVEFYVRKLLAIKLGNVDLQQSDIGVISPYLAQLVRLKEVIGAEWPQIEMGTTEYFQGREKRVIIISTVKSQGGVGFLSNEKRCNVMLTRAKSLEIVIGNPTTLRKDPFWKAFVDYCTLNGGFVDDCRVKLKMPR